MQARRDAVCPVLRAGASLPPHTKKGPPLAIKHRPLTLLSLFTISELHHPRRSCGHECPDDAPARRATKLAPA